MEKNNIFKNIPGFSENELFEEIFKTKNFRVEKITSFGNSSPTDFWYNQKENELVFLLRGSATIQFRKEKIFLEEGDYITIPAHMKHRVDQTDKNEATVWIAVFYPPDRP